MSESNSNHVHLINSNKVQDESAVCISGMPNVMFTTSDHLTFRLKTKITLRKKQSLTFQNTSLLLKEWVAWKKITEF